MFSRSASLIGIIAVLWVEASITSCKRTSHARNDQSYLVQIQREIRINTDSIDFNGENVSIHGHDSFHLSDVKLIRLKTADSNTAISTVEKVFFRHDKVYCFDLTREGAVSIFNQDGIWLGKVSGSSGQLPGYKSLVDGRVNKITGNIELLGMNQHERMAFLRYDSLGRQAGTFPTKFPGRLNFYPVGDYYYFYKGFQDPRGAFDVSEEDKEGEGKWSCRLFGTKQFNLDIGSEYLPYKESKDVGAALPFECFTSLSARTGSDTALLFEDFNDTIYSVFPNGVKARNLVRLVGGKDKPAGFLSDDKVKNKTEYLLKNKMPVLINYMENDDVIMILFSFVLHSSGQRTIENALFDKKTRTLTLFNNNRLQTDMDGIPFVLDYETFPILMSQADGRFVSVIRPDYLLQRLREEPDNTGPMHLFCSKLGLNDLSINQNPILLLYNIKSNK
jgi:hypothetical protein